MPFTGCVKFPSHFWEALASGHGRTRTLRRTLRPFHQDLAESTGPRAGDRGVGFLGQSLVRIEVLCAGAEWEGGGSAEPDAPRITAGEAGGLGHLRGQGVVATPHPCATECDVSSSFARLGARPRGRAAGSCCSGAAVRVRSRNVTSLWASAGCSTPPTPRPPRLLATPPRALTAASEVAGACRGAGRLPTARWSCPPPRSPTGQAQFGAPASPLRRAGRGAERLCVPLAAAQRAGGAVSPWGAPAAPAEAAAEDPGPRECCRHVSSSVSWERRTLCESRTLSHSRSTASLRAAAGACLFGSFCVWQFLPTWPPARHPPPRRLHCYPQGTGAYATGSVQKPVFRRSPKWV